MAMWQTKEVGEGIGVIGRPRAAPLTSSCLLVRPAIRARPGP